GSSRGLFTELFKQFESPSAYEPSRFVAAMKRVEAAVPRSLVRQHPHLYEISAWPWLERLSRRESRAITLAEVPGAEWDAIASQGMDIVYLMGVWQRSAVGRLMARTDPSLISEYDRVLPGWGMEDVPGSPYCIQAYEPDERMGGWRGLDPARAELARRGMALVLDFVPNHTGFD